MLEVWHLAFISPGWNSLHCLHLLHSSTQTPPYPYSLGNSCLPPSWTCISHRQQWTSFQNCYKHAAPNWPKCSGMTLITHIQLLREDSSTLPLTLLPGWFGHQLTPPHGNPRTRKGILQPKGHFWRAILSGLHKFRVSVWDSPFKALSAQTPHAPTHHTCNTMLQTHPFGELPYSSPCLRCSELQTWTSCVLGPQGHHGTQMKLRARWVNMASMFYKRC